MSTTFRDRYLPVLEETNKSRARLESLEQRVADLKCAIEDTKGAIGRCERREEELVRGNNHLGMANPQGSPGEMHQATQVQTGFTDPGRNLSGDSAVSPQNGIEDLIHQCDREIEGLKARLSELESQLSHAKTECGNAKSDLDHKKGIVRAFIEEAERGTRESGKKAYDLQGAYNGAVSDAQEVRTELQEGITYSRHRESDFRNHWEELTSFLKDLDNTSRAVPQVGRYAPPGRSSASSARPTNDYSPLTSVIDKFQGRYSPGKVREWFSPYRGTYHWLSETIQRYSAPPEGGRASESYMPIRPYYYGRVSPPNESRSQETTIDEIIKRVGLRMYDYNKHHH